MKMKEFGPPGGHMSLVPPLMARSHCLGPGQGPGPGPGPGTMGLNIMLCTVHTTQGPGQGPGPGPGSVGFATHFYHRVRYREL